MFVYLHDKQEKQNVLNVWQATIQHRWGLALEIQEGTGGKAFISLDRCVLVP